MSVFFLKINLDTKNTNVFEQGYFNKFSLEYYTSSKFANDKVNYQNENYYLLIDGIILNRNQLQKVAKDLEWAEYLLKSYQEIGSLFFKRLKGSYYGFLYDKRDGKLLVFSDHIGSKPIYYSISKEFIYIANNFTTLINHLKQNKQSITIDESAAYLLLSYGFVYEDITIINEVKRLMVGYYIAIHDDKLRLEKYYTLTNEPINISEKDAIEEIDIRFREAVQLSFEKDIEYNYKHVASLSGGLDSRMTVWVAHDLGYTNQLNLTFSQSNYLDESIAKQIAADLKHEWIFKALDNGTFLQDIDIISLITGGNVLYYGLAHSRSLMKYLDFENLGILHSGQLGDVVISTYNSNLNTSKKGVFGDGSYSNALLSKLKLSKFKEDYPNEEIFKMYIRGFYGINQGLLGVNCFTETFSPFYNIDFMDFALSIPLEMRFNHHLYKKWIIQKYPQAAKYVWEKEKVPVNYRYWCNIKGKRIPLIKIPVKLFSKIGLISHGISSKNHMNPLEYWYQTNKELKYFMDSYFKDNINLLDAYPELKTDCENLYNNLKGTEKNQVLSLLSGIKTIR